MNRNKKFDYIDKQWMIDNWVNTNMSLKSLSIREGCSESLIDTRRSKYGLKKPYKHKINLDKLKDVSDPILCYFAGLIASDGWLWKDRHYVELNLTGESEYDLLNKLNSYFENERPVKKFSGSYRLTFSGNGIKDIFINYFNIPVCSDNKTFTIRFPEKFESEDCARMFIRGVFDGDGSIHVPKRIKDCRGNYDAPSVCMFQASELFAQGLVQFINDNNLTTTKAFVKYHKGTETGNYYPGVDFSSRQCKEFLDWMYLGNTDFLLQRKYEKYLKIKDSNSSKSALGPISI